MSYTFLHTTPLIFSRALPMSSPLHILHYYSYPPLYNNSSSIVSPTWCSPHPSTDPRTSQWPLMSSILPITYISLAYIVFVLVVPPLMKMRGRPFEIKRLMTVYNVALVFISLYMGVEVSHVSCIAQAANNSGHFIFCCIA